MSATGVVSATADRIAGATDAAFKQGRKQISRATAGALGASLRQARTNPRSNPLALRQLPILDLVPQCLIDNS